MLFVGQILLDHPLSYALTATADVLTVYLQQFWKKVSKVPDTKDTIKFKLDTQEITYTVDMFRDTLKLLVETPDNPFITPYPSIPHRLDEDYHSIKDDILLVSVYSTGNVLFRGMLILDAFLTDEIRATDDYKEYETVFVGVEVSLIQPQPVVSTQGTHRTTPIAHRKPTITAASPQGKKRKQSDGETISPRKSLKVTIRLKKQSTTLIPSPGDDRERDEMAEATLLSLTLYKTTLATKAQENIAKVQEKLKEKEIEKMVEGEEDKESHASELADSMFNDDDDSDDDVDKTDDVAEEKDNDDHIDHILVRTHATELTVNGSPTAATTSKSKSKRGFISNKTKILPGSIAGMCRRRGQICNHIKIKFVTHEFFMGKIREVLNHYNSVVPEMTFAKTNEMIKEEMPRRVYLAVNKDREIAPINVP
ncbi:hypothetical protein Tco_0990924 [Tanacetum coccineum]|uniref:Uncharacterized protein n=1 Tax=Tanacetum coccineum TaxID=301880 RepID=A0ABQ5EY27_9ASTR